MAQKVSTTLGDRGRLEPGVAEDGKQQEVGLPGLQHGEGRLRVRALTEE
jgi:hypothetical protein